MRGDEIRKLLGRHLRARRLELALTQAKLAKILRVKQPYIASLEAGTCSISLDVLGKLAETLRTSPSALLSTEEIFLAKSS